MIAPGPRSERVIVAAALVAAFILFNLYSLVTPLFEASDELWHYPFVQHLANGGGLPVQRPDQTDADAPWRQEGSQPPLYYALAALMTAPAEDANWREIRRPNPHADMGVPTRDGNANAILHTPAEQFPWTRAALAARLARLVSIILSTLTVWFAYLVGAELFPRPPAVDNRPDPNAWLRLGTLVFTACVPMFAFISGSVNNDNAAVLFSTMGVWWALRMVRLRDTSPRAALIAGLIASAGTLSKSSALGLVGLLGLAAALAAVKRETSDVRRETKDVKGEFARFTFYVLRFTLTVVAIVAACAGWWFVRNQILYGDLLGWNAFLDAVGRRAPAASLAQLWTEREGFVWAYWGVFGGMNVIMPPWVYDLLNGIVIVAVAGAVWGVFRASNVKRETSNADGTLSGGDKVRAPFIGRLASLVDRHSALIVCVFWVALIFVAFLRWTSLTPASQGRLMFPCISVIAAGISYGLYRIHRIALWAGAALLAAIALAMPFAVIAPAYAPPPDEWRARLSTPIHADFGGIVRLEEGAASAQTATPGDEVTLNLNWQLTAAAPANYSVFVHLIDENDVIVAQRDMYPGQGRLALSELPAGRSWTDHYTLRIPALAHAPRTLRWAVGVYDFVTGQRLALPDGTDRATFGALALERRSDQDESVLLRYENGLELLDYTLAPAALLPGSPLSVTTRWRVSRAVVQDLNISLQLLDEQSNKIAQQDLGQPLTQWHTSEAVEITHELAVNADAPPGVYRLLLVWYAASDFARPVAYGADGQFAGDQIELTRLRVR